MMRNLIYGTCTLILLVTFSISSGCRQQKISPISVNGVLDLRQWDFPKDGTVNLNGQWAFYWQQMVPPSRFSAPTPPIPSGMIKVPGHWNEFQTKTGKVSGSGYATYHLRVLLPDDAHRLGLKLLDMATAYTLYVNGIKQVASGAPGKTREESLPLYRPQVTDLGPRKGVLDIVAHVSNFHHWQGGAWEPVRLGLTPDVQWLREKNILWDFFLLGSILIMGIYHFGLFLTRTGNRSTLYFSLFNFLIAIRMMTTGERFLSQVIPGLSFRVEILMVYITLFLILPLFALYVRALFPKEVAKSAVLVNLILAGFFLLFVMVSPLPMLTYSMPVFQLTTLVMMVYGAWITAKAVFQNRQGSLIFLGGFLVLAVAAVNDILYTRQIISTGHLLPFGFFVFIFSQALLLYQRFSRAYSTIEKQWQELAKTNMAYQKELKSRIRVQAALKESESQYRELIEDSADGICIVRKGIILYANPMFLDRSGLDKSDFGRISFLTFIHPDDHGKILKRYGKNVPDEKVPGHFAIRGVNGGERIYHLEVNASVIEWEKKPAILTFVRDMTEQTRTRELLFQSEKMLSVGGLAAGMAHEINNPLAGMMLNAQLIKSRLSPGIPANEEAAGETGIRLEKINGYARNRGIYKYLDHIVVAGQNAADIVDNMLSFSRKSPNKKGAWQLDIIVDKTLALAENDFQLKKQYDFKEIRITKDYDLDLGLVRCEETKIRQVLLNLFKNAAQAMGSTGTATSESAISVRTFQDMNMACLTIRDNGPGMDDSVRKRIFEPFFTTKGVNKGTGLGLSISYFIITEDHGGQMDVTSEPDQGTEFIIRLPLA